MMEAPTGLTKPLGAVMATRPASKPLPLIEASGLPFEAPHVEHGAERSGAACQHGVHGDRADAQVAVRGSAQRAAGIESEPAEGEDEAADQHGRNVVADDRIAEPSRLNLPMRGPMISATASAVIPPTACTTPDPAKSQ